MFVSNYVEHLFCHDKCSSYTSIVLLLFWVELPIFFLTNIIFKVPTSVYIVENH